MSSSSPISQLVSTPSTANFSIFSSAESYLSRSTPSPGAYRNNKRAGNAHERTVPQKRRKLMGRPRNGWTPSRRRKLIRLYLMTNLEVVEISKVLEAYGFKTSKRDIQNQLADLLQPRPNQIRSRGHITQERLRLLREYKAVRRTNKAQRRNQKSLIRKVVRGNESPGSSSETCPSSAEYAAFDWPWLHPHGEGDEFPGHFSTKLVEQQNTQSETTVSDPFLVCSDALATEEPFLEHNSFAFSFDSLNPFLAPVGVAAYPNLTGTPLADTTEKCLLAAEENMDIQSQPPFRNVPMRPTVLGPSLRKSLSQLTSKHTSTILEDVVSIMEHLTISTSSAASSVPTGWSKAASSTHLPILEEEIPLPARIEYPVLLPGAFPEYCWEQINHGNLRRCNRGEKYRKTSPICTHTGRSSSNTASKNIYAKYDVYENLQRVKVDIFGNSALHISAALATPPHFLSDLVKSSVNVHTINNGGQTFLHLIHPRSRGFCDDGSRTVKYVLPDICDLLRQLKDLNFDFSQQDHNGRTTLHWLTRPDIPHSTFSRVNATLQNLGVKLPPSRDNLGLTLPGQLERLGVPDLLHVNNPILYENEFTSNYAKSTGIETIEDLQRFELHADLLRTILESQKNPQFENWRGRNGLHCLAEVSFDLHLSKEGSIPIQPTKSGCGRREVYLESLIESGVDPNSYDKEGTTPLMAFIIHTRAGEDDISTHKILMRLFEAGADIHRRNRQGETALHIAVKLGRKIATTFLLDVGANVHARTSKGHGIYALGQKYANKDKDAECTYGQIMLCMSLVMNAKAVPYPTVLQEWGVVKEGFVVCKPRKYLERKVQFRHPDEYPRVPDAVSLSPPTKSGRETPDYFGREARYKSPARSFSAPRPPTHFKQAWDSDRFHAPPKPYHVEIDPLPMNKI